MIRDFLLQLIFIPLLGISLPLLSELITYSNYSFFEIGVANAFFILTSFVIWKGCNWIHVKLRPLKSPATISFSRIGVICFISALYGSCTGLISSLAWMKFSKETFYWISIVKFIAACSAAVIIFTLIYEILFLSKEQELNSEIVDRLDKELTQAELQVLTNELDPHFIFNSLNALNHLIKTNPAQAHSFNNRLAQVYKYFLLNKKNKLITLQEELQFIKDYFFLLCIRYDNKIHLQTYIDDGNRTVMIPPCSLQVLVENAIKHNEFTEANPLVISITANENYVQVSNNIKAKIYSAGSTGIGLKNLSSRYQLLLKKDIIITTSSENYIVKLPLIT